MQEKLNGNWHHEKLNRNLIQEKLNRSRHHEKLNRKQEKPNRNRYQEKLNRNWHKEKLNLNVISIFFCGFLPLFQIFYLLLLWKRPRWRRFVVFSIHKQSADIKTEYSLVFLTMLTETVTHQMWLYFPLPTLAIQIFHDCHVVFVDKTSGIPWYRPLPPPKSLSTASLSGPGYRSLYSDLLRAGRSWDRIPARARFSAPVQTGPGPHPASYTIRPGHFPRGVKRPGRGVEHPTPSIAEVEERVELYLYSPLDIRDLY
jgi:hypothetical protein